MLSMLPEKTALLRIYEQTFQPSFHTQIWSKHMLLYFRYWQHRFNVQFRFVLTLDDKNYGVSREKHVKKKYDDLYLTEACNVKVSELM